MVKMREGMKMQESLELKSVVEEKPVVNNDLQAELPVVSEVRNEAVSASDAALSEMMGDAPACPTCGHITVRNGSCYKCLNCGDSLGCS